MPTHPCMVNFQPMLVLLFWNIPSSDTRKSAIHLFRQSPPYTPIYCIGWCLFKPMILDRMGMIATGIQWPAMQNNVGRRGFLLLALLLRPHLSFNSAFISVSAAHLWSLSDCSFSQLWHYRGDQFKKSSESLCWRWKVSPCPHLVMTTHTSSRLVKKCSGLCCFFFRNEYFRIEHQLCHSVLSPSWNPWLSELLSSYHTSHNHHDPAQCSSDRAVPHWCVCVAWRNGKNCKCCRKHAQGSFSLL